MPKKVADASMEDAEQAENVDTIDVDDENEEQEEVGEEGDVEENAEGAEEAEGEEQAEGEEEADDDHEIADVEGEEAGEGEEGGEGDGEEVAEEDPKTKFPEPLENIGKFEGIDDPALKALMQKTTLTFFDGTKGLLLSRGPKYSDEKWPINCHICYESGIYSLDMVKEHLTSARHVRMSRWRPTDPKYKHMKAFRQPFDDDDPSLTPIFIYPGEVITEITPDLLDRIISKDKVPEREFAEMIGLSYAYKMKRFGKEVYDCMLCKKVVTVLHFAGQKHMDHYMEFHFPKTWKKLANMIKEGKLGWSTPLPSQQNKYCREAIREIYKKIEEEKGLRQPKFVNYRDFKLNRYTYHKQARSKKHYDEKTIEITDEMLTDYLKKAHEKLGDPKVVPEEDEKESKSRRRSKTRDAGRLTSDTRKSSRIIENNPQVWDRYRRMVGAIMDDLEETYQKYRKNLESHPKYKTEWKKFWHNRADELERDGIDPHNYDFNKEWIPYWEKRLSEFHAKEIVRHKFETKRKLNLSYDVRSPSPVRRRRRSSPRRRSVSPRGRHGGRRRSRDGSDYRSSKRSRREDDGPVTVCAVMRLAAAIEDYLGSLGPQAVQLLSRAVLTEKSNPNPDCLLLENDYYIFFMTAKEKLKGQLLANIVEPRKISAVNRAVDQITAIIRRFEDYRARHSGGSRGGFSGSGSGIGSFADNNQSNRNPSQFSGGNRGGVWHSGNYRNDSAGGNNAQNQSFNRSMVPNSFGGGDDGFLSGGNDYGNRGGAMNMSSGGSGGNRPQNFGRMDLDNNGTGSSYGGNFTGMRNSRVNRGYGANEDFRRNAGGVYGRGKGNTPGKVEAPTNRNQMGGNSRSNIQPLDLGDMNRGGSNQMSYNRGGTDTSSFGGSVSGNRPWSSGYNPPNTYNNGDSGVGGGNYGGIGGGGGGSNWNSGDFGGNVGGNQGFNNRSLPMAPPFNRNITSSRY